MSIIRFSNQLPNVLNRYFDEPNWAYPNFRFNHSVNQPLANILEHDEGFKVELAVPGLSKADLTIELNNQYLTISAQPNSAEETQTGVRYSQKEFGYRNFSRSFIVPNVVDREQINATCENGVLTVTLPKKEEAKPKPVKQILVS